MSGINPPKNEDAVANRNDNQIEGHINLIIYRPLRPLLIFSLHSLQYHLTKHTLAYARKKKLTVKLTILPWGFRQPHTRQMEPFAWTGIIVTGDHLAETDLITIAVSGLAFFIFIVTFVNGFLI